MTIAVGMSSSSGSELTVSVRIGEVPKGTFPNPGIGVTVGNVGACSIQVEGKAALCLDGVLIRPVALPKPTIVAALKLPGFHVCAPDAS